MSVPRIISGSPLKLRKVGATGRRYELLERFVYASAIVGRFEVEAGFITNFHSIPFGLRNTFAPDDYAESAVAHDFLYERGAVPQLLFSLRRVTRREADQVHREILVLMGAPAWKVRLMYRGLRLFGWVQWRRYRRKNDVQRAFAGV